MNRRKICHISTAHSENDNRILFKECSSLKNAGYDVYFIVTSDKEKKINGVNITPLTNNSSRLYRMFFKRKEAYKKALELNADIYHFHDPELIALGVKLKKAGKKVIYDVHEDMPKQILSKSYLGPLWIRKIISKGFNKYEKINAKKFDGIVTILDELKDKFKLYNSNSITIKNYAIKDVIYKSKSKERNIDSNKFVILYIGSITRIRGVKEIIRVTERFKGQVELWLIGTWETEELKKECENLSGYKYTKYFGVFNSNELYTYVKAADLGISTLHPTPNYKKSIPTKVIEYMACELPVVLSNFEYWKALFGDVGIYVDPLNINDIADAINYYIHNKQERKIIGKQNKKIFEEKFSWDTEEKKLLELYENLYLN
ncbi:glycosyltransferase family 4 protein [Clostridium carnis]